MDIQNMMKQAQEMQERLQQEMSQLSVQATAGGGMVTVTVNGHKHLQRISPQRMVFTVGRLKFYSKSRRFQRLLKLSLPQRILSAHCKRGRSLAQTLQRFTRFTSFLNHACGKSTYHQQHERS